MSHEQSETIQRADGKWINVYGRRTSKAGQQLPGTEAYDTVEDAVAAAKKRSKRPAAILKALGVDEEE